MGAQGDGIAEGPRGRLYIPCTVPGDYVRARPTTKRADGYAADLVELLSPGPERAEPPCRHFGDCGGCRLQHLNDDAYVRWKHERLTIALTRAGIHDYTMDPLARTPPRARRRAVFSAIRPALPSTPPLLGFKCRESHEIVDLADCPVLHPHITAILPRLRDLLADLLSPRQSLSVSVTLLATGLDIVLEWPNDPDLTTRERLAKFTETADVARLSWRWSAASTPEPIAQRRAASIEFGGVLVPFPPDGFLQASADGEEALVNAVRDAICRGPSPKTKVADLFAGAGTFTLPLANVGIGVHAIDSDCKAVSALSIASRAFPHVTSVQRDLFARPLTPGELSIFQAIVFDPPRAGARTQAEQIAQSSVPLVIAVSCNPDTFARDARILASGGYTLKRITPIDQFLWSPHLELAALFRR